MIDSDDEVEDVISLLDIKKKLQEYFKKDLKYLDGLLIDAYYELIKENKNLTEVVIEALGKEFS